MKEQSRALLTSPVIHKVPSVDVDEKHTCNCACCEGVESRILNKLKTIIDGKLDAYFTPDGIIESRLDKKIDGKFLELMNTSINSNNESRMERFAEGKIAELNANSANPLNSSLSSRLPKDTELQGKIKQFQEDYEDFLEKYKLFTQNCDKVDTLKKRITHQYQ